MAQKVCNLLMELLSLKVTSGFTAQHSVLIAPWILTDFGLDLALPRTFLYLSAHWFNIYNNSVDTKFQQRKL